MVSFGLFLQKLNILRDFEEDRVTKKRSFWPQCYFQGEENHVKILNRMCFETLSNDVPNAVAYFKQIPPHNETYDYFIRFILSSGIEYLKMLKNNRSVFSQSKVKLPKSLIKNLYAKVSSLSSMEFGDYCDRFLREEVAHYRSLLGN